MKEKKAIELCGGEAVFKRINGNLIPYLDSVIEGGRASIVESDLGLPTGVLADVRNKKKHMTVEWFNLLAGEIGKTLTEFFDTPKYASSSERKEWVAIMGKNPVYVIGMLGDGDPSKCIIELDDYVKMAAVQDVHEIQSWEVG